MATTTAPEPFHLDDLKLHTLADDMTLAERQLLELPSTSWGTPAQRVHRGALYLDRVIPDWYERVAVKVLDLRDGCRCVLGQIFSTAAYEAASAYHAQVSTPLLEEVKQAGIYSLMSSGSGSGWVTGCAVLGVRSGEGAAFHNYDAPATMLGFDLGDTDSDSSLNVNKVRLAWDELTDLWRDAVSTRQAAT